MEDSCRLLYFCVVDPLSRFFTSTIGIVCGKPQRKAMALSSKVASTAESSEDHSLQEQVAKMMAMVEAYVQ